MTQFDLIGRIDAGMSADDVLVERERRVGMFTESNKARARTYYASPALQIAADVALTLGRPLLLTGEPGSGKTLAAFWLAARLGLEDRFQEYQVRSDSRARDLCYEFDAVSWFRESQIHGQKQDKKAFISPRALGKAFGWRDGETGKPHVVLIDEIDKAPRDFPNDLLLELDQMRFDIPETGEVIGPPGHRPIIVITSNSERKLPDPFLRRCVTHHIKIDEETVAEILKVRISAYAGTSSSLDIELIAAGSAFWSSLAEFEGRLTRKPTVAEFWQWLVLANEYPKPGIDLVGILKTKRGREIRKLTRIESLFLEDDLAVVAAG